MIRKNLTQIEHDIFKICKTQLSDGAKVLYGFLATMHTTQIISDNQLKNILNISHVSLMKYKKELASLDLILWIKRGKKLPIIYIGSIYYSASTLAVYWKHLDDEGIK